MQDLTEGSIGKHLLRMSGALLLSALTGTLLALANFYWLGRLGVTAQAAVTLAAMPVMLVMTLLPILSMGTGVLVSHAVGAKDRERANRIFNETFGASLLAAVLVALVMWINRAAFSHFMTADEATATLIASYYRWLVPSIAIQVPMLVLAAALEFTGNVRAATLAQSGTVVLNALLTPVLMLGWLGAPRLGIDGAGLAPLLSCGAALLALLVYLAREGSYLTMRPAIWLSRPTELWSALKIGLPTGIESGVVALCLLVIGLMLRPFGPTDQAAFGIGQRVFQAGLMPLSALSGAICVVVGQNYGAKLPARVRDTVRKGLLFGLAVAPALLVAFEGFAPWICGRFSDDPAVIAAAATFVRITALGLIPACTAFIAFAVLSGMGNTRASLLAQLVYVALVIVSTAALSQLPGFQPFWIWIVMVVAGLVQALLGWLFLRRELVEPRRIELLTFSLRTRRSPS